MRHLRCGGGMNRSKRWRRGDSESLRENRAFLLFRLYLITPKNSFFVWVSALLIRRSPADLRGCRVAPFSCALGAGRRTAGGKRGPRSPPLLAMLPVVRYDRVADYSPPRWRVLWVEGRLDCRTWSYYCDVRSAFSALHEVRPLSPPSTELGCHRVSTAFQER